MVFHLDVVLRLVSGMNGCFKVGRRFCFVSVMAGNYSLIKSVKIIQ